MSQQYSAAQVQQQPPKQGNGFGVTALVLGILTVVFSVIPLVGIVAFILGPLAILFGIIGVTRKMKPRGTSIAGIILGIVSVILAGVITASLAGAVNSVSEDLNSAQPSAAADPTGASTPVEEATQEPSAGAVPDETTEAAAPSGNTVVYEVTSDGATAGNVSYATFNNGGMGQEQVTEAPLPFTNEVDLGDSNLFETSIFSLVAQSSQDATTISCKITANGEVISEQTSTGQFAVVSCSGSAN